MAIENNRLCMEENSESDINLTSLEKHILYFAKEALPISLIEKQEAELYWDGTEAKRRLKSLEDYTNQLEIFDEEIKKIWGWRKMPKIDDFHKNRYYSYFLENLRERIKRELEKNKKLLEEYDKNTQVTETEAKYLDDISEIIFPIYDGKSMTSEEWGEYCKEKSMKTREYVLNHNFSYGQIIKYCGSLPVEDINSIEEVKLYFRKCRCNLLGWSCIHKS